MKYSYPWVVFLLSMMTDIATAFLSPVSPISHRKDSLTLSRSVSTSSTSLSSRSWIVNRHRSMSVTALNESLQAMIDEIKSAGKKQTIFVGGKGGVGKVRVGYCICERLLLIVLMVVIIIVIIVIRWNKFFVTSSPLMTSQNNILLFLVVIYCFRMTCCV